MKNVYISSAIVIGVILFVILASVLVSISLKDIEKKIENEVGIPESNEDFESIVIVLEEMQREFSDRKILFSLLVSDKDVEDVKNCFTDAISYARTKSAEGVLTSLERLHNAIESIRLQAQFTLESIF